MLFGLPNSCYVRHKCCKQRKLSAMTHLKTYLNTTESVESHHAAEIEPGKLDDLNLGMSLYTEMSIVFVSLACGLHLVLFHTFYFTYTLYKDT